MPTTYTNGLKLPDLGSIDWFNAYKNNIDILDPIVGTVNGVATTYAPISHNHDASEITSGTIDIARLPPAALERLHTVADQTARYALTTSTVQEGDTVKQLDTGVMYLVVDVTKLNSADGYTEYSAGTASKAIADEDGNSIKSTYGKLAGIQTWTGINTFRNINPETNSTYSLGTSSYRWSAVYADSYYYGTTSFTDKFVTTDTSQTLTANKNIKNSEPSLVLLSNQISKGVAPASNKNMMLYFKDNDNAELGRILYRAYADGTRQMWLAITDNYTNGALSPTGTNRWNNLFLNIEPTGASTCAFSVDKVVPNTTASIDLGTSTNKWKSLNGINPGALSLPDASAKVQIEIPASWVWDGTTENSYVAPITGWLAIGSSQATYVRLFNSNSLIGSVVRSPTSSDMRTYIPMLAGDTILISGITSSSFLIRIYPCLGNV